ncbi:IS5 family transposase [Dankookia rubra]|uniref:IS5 family transposase n=1 Tax=Dankookia rubra TaxID=1442381 RepID=UPI003519E882
MAKPLVSDDLWAAIAPLPPPERPRRNGGRKPVSDRPALAGILFVLISGIPWERLPAEMGCGSGLTCWRQLRDWQAAGVWSRLHLVLLERLHGADKLDWTRASLDSASVPAKKGGAATGPNPPDRGKPGTKRHIVVDGHGTPPGLTLSPASRNGSEMLAATLDAIPPVRRRKPGGRPRCRPGRLPADKSYNHRFRRDECRRRGIVARIARRGVEDSSRLGRHRWKVEPMLAWMVRFRRLTIRHERREHIHLACNALPASIIWPRQTRRSG